MEQIKSFIAWIRRCISPVFVTLFFAAFVLWYITKLGYDYTTDYQVAVTVDGKTFDVDCKIHGKGLDLFNFKVLSQKRTFDIPLSELRYEQVEWGSISIDPVSLQRALSSRIADVDLVSVGAVPSIEFRNNGEE
ncbi:MAG: hypothetical protein J6K38_02880 [Alistipes sp.]|nr:hypothetical protein [Alistipes sp.]